MKSAAYSDKWKSIPIIGRPLELGYVLSREVIGMVEHNLSVQKAALLLRLVGEAKGGCTLSELAAESGMALTICHRLVATLEFEGFLEKSRQTSKLRLGSGLIGLAGKALNSSSVRDAILETLGNVVTETHDSGLLMVLDRGEALCVARIEGDSPTNVVGTRIGSRAPLHCGGGPFAILAFSSDESIEDYLSRPLDKRTDKTIVDPALIWARIEETRQRGFAVGDEDLFPYIVAVAVPVFEPDGRLLGAVSIGHLKQRYDHARIAEVGALLLRNFSVPLLGREEGSRSGRP